MTQGWTGEVGQVAPPNFLGAALDVSRATAFTAVSKPQGSAESTASPAFHDRDEKSSTNAKYVAFAYDNGYLIHYLDDPGQSHWYCDDSVGELKRKCVVQLCSIRKDRLAISCGTQTYIRNVLGWTLEHKLPGNGRNVTSLAWSQHDARLLAIGTVDGSISIWSVSTSMTLLQRLSSGGPASRTIAFSPHDSSILASSHHNMVHVWSLHRPKRPCNTLTSTYGSIIDIQWNPKDPGILLATTDDENAVLWQLAYNDASLDETSTGDGNLEVFGDFDDTERSTESISGYRVHAGVCHAAWIQELRLLVLTQNRREILFLELDAERRKTGEVARIFVEANVHALDLWSPYGRLIARTYSPDNVGSHEIPPVVFEHKPVRRNSDAPSAQAPLDKNPSCDVDGSTTPPASIHSRECFPSMRPISIMQKRKRLPIRSCKRTRISKDQPRTTDQQLLSTRNAVSRSRLSSDSVLPEVISSLELPNVLEEDNSPMPFLSPTIPARKSPTTLGLEESLQLPLLPEISLKILSVAHGHDSDSDDETFAPDMSGSGTLMPGGGNVPLPRMCGALFGPSGQLVIFLPPRRPLITSRQEQIPDVVLQQPKAKDHTFKLFPTFGNLISTDVQSSKLAPVFPGDTGHAAKNVTIQPSSQPNRLIWQIGPSPQRIENSPLDGTCTINLRVYDVTSLLLINSEMAGQCRTSCDDGESGADLCRHNAKVVDEAGSCDVANIWRLLAMILEYSVPVQTFKTIGDEEDISVIAREASILNGKNTTKAAQEFGGKLGWAEHPLGPIWLIEQILLWAEQRADIHLLAYVSAILCRSEAETFTIAQQAVLTKLPSFSKDFSVEVEHRPLSHGPFHSIPLLPTNSSLANYLDELPVKTRQNSAASSRQPSLPTTPLLDPSSSTPPFIFPALSRHGSRASASGSASPEHHRSSFGAAAKYYAQSITDKISSYGTSPPLKRGGVSPNTTELASSLPAGSWGKSVSFASAISTTRDSQLSRSYTVGDDGYDSDKTIDEASLPHTPRSNQGAVTVMMKNLSLFSDEGSGGTQSALIPTKLVTKTAVWRQYYAEQLRVWGLWMQAAELEKVSCLEASKTPGDFLHEGPVVVRAPGQRRPSCSICLSTVKGLQQACPRCLHTTHLTCLIDYVHVLGKEEYACPASCDCVCTAAASASMDSSAINAVQLSTATRLDQG
nr:putative histone-binding protein lin-53 [Quercus suber]